MELTPLCKIAEKYGTDKCPQIFHDYTPVYYELFKYPEGVRKVLEVGIGNPSKMKHINEKYSLGASLKMWREFFPNAQIYGIDHDKDTIFQDERITTYHLNSYKTNHVDWLFSQIGGDIDLVVDDGNHEIVAQVKTAKNILPHLKKGAIYVCEDSKDPLRLADNLIGYNYEARIFSGNQRNTLLIIRI